MAKNKKVTEDNEERIVKEKIEKRFKSMFSGEKQPLSNMSIQEVETLKARVAELEARLEGQPTAGAEQKRVSATQIISPETKPSGVNQVVQPAQIEAEQKRKGFLQNLLSAPILANPAKNRVARLQHKILLGLFAASLLAVFILLWNWSETTPESLGILLLAMALFALASFWQRGGHLERASWILVGTLYSILLFSMFRGSFSASTVIQAAIIISLAGLLLAPFSVIVVTLVTSLSLVAIQIIFPTVQIDQNQVMFTILLLGLEGLLLTVASRTLEESFAEADRSTQDLRHANQSLQSLMTNLEQRVEERTHDLELATEVGRTVSEKVKNISEMLTEAAEMIRARFNLYYTQIYLADPSGKSIILRAGTGTVGKELLQKGHSLQIDSGSLNGRAASEKSVVIVTDTTTHPSFLPNPLLPKTRSEMSIPLIVDGKVVGVLDMQSEQPGALNENNLPAFQALAGQLAIAVENARLLAQAEEARSEVESQMRRFTEQGWQDFLDAIERGQKIGFAFKQSEIIRLDLDTFETKDLDLSIPISIVGTKIGEVHLPAQPNHTWTDNELQLIKATSAQLAQHIENLRLLAQAERYRAEAEQAVQRLTHEGWNSFVQTHTELESGYVFDLMEVKPLSEKSNGRVNYAVKHPMVVGDQIIGELALDIPDQSDESAEVLAAVAEQLSGHIENLRLSELNERHAQREQTLRQITSALRSSNNPATIMRTAVRELGTIMGRRAIVQLASPQKANQAETTVINTNESDAPAHQS